MPDPFEQLGLPPDAPAHDVRARFRELVLTQHPDVGGDPATFQATRAAYALALVACANRVCLVCGGTGRVSAGDFGTFTVTCPRCHGEHSPEST